MLLKAITLENFKGIREPIRIGLKPVTLLFGPNSAGKSTIVQALHYAHEILERGIVDPDRTMHGGQAVELGGFLSLVHGHERERVIKLRFELDLEKEELPAYRLPYVTSYSELESMFNVEQRIKPAELELAVAWSEFLGKPSLTQYELIINKEKLSAIVASIDERRIQLNGFWTNHPIFWPEGESEVADKGLSIEELTEFPIGELSLAVTEIVKEQYDDMSWLNLDLAGQESVLPHWDRPLQFPEYIWKEGADPANIREITERISRLVVGPLELLRKSIKNFLYLGPLRTVPPRNFTPVRSPVESRWAHGLAAWDLLMTEREPLVSNLNKWLEGETHFNTGYRMSVKNYKAIDKEGPLYLALNRLDQVGSELADVGVIKDYLKQAPERQELSVVEVNSGTVLEPQDLGVGLSEMVPVIVAALWPKNGIVAIEQPELHIHPAWQTVLGDLFATQIQNPNVIFLIESHSEHLLLRLLRRIRESGENDLPPGAPRLVPEDIAVYYAEYDGGTTKYSRLRIDQTGEFIDRWPHGFFEERAEELF